MKRIIFFAAIALALSGCGGGSSSGSANTELAADAFTSKVLSMTAMTSDTSEPSTVDSFTATAPEDTPPMPLI